MQAATDTRPNNSVPYSGLVSEPRGRSDWVRLHTIVWLRWVALAGQIVAVTVSAQLFELVFPWGLVTLAIGLAIIGNLIAAFVYPENKRLSESENFIMVMFDLLQLSFLLYLTGGLNNPFTMLMIGPVTISAGVLRLRATLVLSLGTILLVTLLGRYYIPLQTQAGDVLVLPPYYLYGMWGAITIGIVFLSLYSRRVSNEMHLMAEALQATQMALAREQKLTDLGGVVAATAHEMGTPLATIKLTSNELAEELEDALPERTDLIEDAKLIKEQSDRCRDILRDMGRAGKDDLHMRQAPIADVVREASEPHQGRGVEIRYSQTPGPGGDAHPPPILRRPEIIHGLRNLIQNAVDFAGSTVWVEALWTDDLISLRIMDDGPGFPPHLLGRIGEPFMGTRKPDGRAEDYEGMGLGLFIAKTMLERTGAELDFTNGRDPWNVPYDKRALGAVIEVVWPRSKIDARDGDFAIRPGQNELILR